VGGSAIRASKTAGHSDLEMNGEYTFVAPERQIELTRRIHKRLVEAADKDAEKTAEPRRPIPSAPETPPNLANAEPATPILQ